MGTTSGIVADDIFLAGRCSESFDRLQVKGTGPGLVSFQTGELPVDQLLAGLREMFSHRQSKVIARKQFEERTWKKGETFNDYFHEKAILANRVPVADDEILDYIIDGIPDPVLRDQARIQGFSTKASLLRAFQRITIGSKVQPTTGSSRKSDDRGSKIPMATGAAERESRRGGKRCFNCAQIGHVSANCPTKSKGAKCFHCGEFGHIAVKCPKSTSVPKEANAVKNGDNDVTMSRKRYCKNVEIAGRSMIALIDTGSDLSLMRAEQYVRIGAPALQNEEIPFRGIGTQKNATLGKFRGDIVMDGNIYSIGVHVVPDELMQHDLLIGAEFIDTVELVIRGRQVSISKLADSNLLNCRVTRDFRDR